MSGEMDAAVQEHAEAIRALTSNGAARPTDVVLIIHRDGEVSMSVKVDSIMTLQELLMQALLKAGWKR